MSTTTVSPSSFLSDLDRVARTRREIAAHLSEISDTIAEAESEAQQGSGQFDLAELVQDLALASQTLRRGVFRLLVLGDMKRGKSTFLNALIGERLLPSDVNPCTAVLTILKHGPEKRVTIHHKGNQPARVIDFQAFKQEYTIDPDEAKQLEQNQQLAFPDVSHAVVEYPLPILEKGIEIVDSPGLNDTEARNELSLNYIHHCHGILFVMLASQPCTLTERRYLENFIKGRGLSVFFLINAWDQVKASLVDPDNAEELQEAEERLRQVFRANLAEYCEVDGYDLYDERVFEISSLKALRRRVKDGDADLTGTGFPAFIQALNTFLTQERAIVEMGRARLLAKQAQTRVHEAVERRIPLLDQDLQQLKGRIESVEPEFEQLNRIREEFRDEISTVQDRKARAIAESFRTYLLGLERTFETDFQAYQPDLKFWDFLRQGKRDEFMQAMQEAFEQYINDKFFAWTSEAERELEKGFEELGDSAAQYGASYSRIVDVMTEKLTGQPVVMRSTKPSEDNSPGWASWAMSIFSLGSGNWAGLALAATGFDWKTVLLNNLVAILSFGLVAALLAPIAPILPIVIPVMTVAGVGVGALQVDHARKELTRALRQEFAKAIPQVAQDQWQTIYNAVVDCFDRYKKEVMRRINEDIQSRKSELENLTRQKESREIDQVHERTRLQDWEKQVTTAAHSVERIYQEMLM